MKPTEQSVCMKRQRDAGSSSSGGSARADRIELNVGGEIFTSSISTLVANSAYFSALFSRWDSKDEGVEQQAVFLDRDSDAFRVLLSCMRHKKALLPEGDRDLCIRAMLDAEVLGLDWLVHEVKATAWDREDSDTKDERLDDYNLQLGLDDDSRLSMDGLATEHKVALFDQMHGSLEKAVKNTILPGLFFASLSDAHRIKQLIPCPKDDTVVFFKNGDAAAGAESRRAVCLALVEGPRGHTHIEPVVRGRGIRKADPLAPWDMADYDEQLVTATEYMVKCPGLGYEDWAYAYKGEADVRGLEERVD